MSGIDLSLEKLSACKASGYWADRIISQLEFFRELDKRREGEYTSLLARALDYLSICKEQEGVITKSAAQECEKQLQELSPVAKQYTLLCAAHAHIDMNWMWRFDETVSVVLDTFRTMLTLMEEFPQFVFSQSQASVYRIVEKYDPQMLQEIKKRVLEGRWEVTASSWVEADKNMPSGESQARHILYTKQYLSKLLDIDPDLLNIDFEPDTFGHSANVPETLAQGGVKYYYHCRGRVGPALYCWEAPSGRSVISYCDPTYYGGDITTSIVMHMPGYLQDTGHNTMLFVYGVGDHGGGPSRRDIRRILDMNTWPLMPNIRCSGYGDFFRSVEKIKDRLPVVKEEANYVFTGCYSSQSRIKTANRISEACLDEAEKFSAVNSLLSGAEYPHQKYAGAWEKTLFNQFHDIITGSGTIDNREYAMAQFQKAMAAANTGKTNALRAIARQIDTSAYIPDDEQAADTASAGAGVGSHTTDFKVSQVCRGSGETRIYTIFNPSLTEREENVEVEIWNWDGNINRIQFKDADGNIAPHQLINEGAATSWGYQKVFRLFLHAKVPACGYNTYVMTVKNDDTPGFLYFMVPGRVDNIPDYTLENEAISVRFNPRTAAIVSFVDKLTGREYADASQPCGIFRYIEENTTQGMTSWRVGPYMNVQNINENLIIKSCKLGQGLLRQSIYFEAEFCNSKLSVNVYLDKNSSNLVYDVGCNWHEFGKHDVKIPQLGFYMPFAYSCNEYKYDIPFGIMSRPDANDDRPANSFAAAVNPNAAEKSVIVTAATKYGFRTHENAIALTLLRSSYDPDIYPEIGQHKFVFSVGLADAGSNSALAEQASEMNHALSVISIKPSKGTLPFKKSFIECINTGSAVASCIKMPESGNRNRLIMRLYETEGKETTAAYRFFKNVKAAYTTDINEQKTAQRSIAFIKDGRLEVKLAPFAVTTVCVELEH